MALGQALTSLGRALNREVNLTKAVAFSPDGRILATSSGFQNVQLWNVANPTHPTPLALLSTADNHDMLNGFFVLSVVFRPDGHTLAMGSLAAVKLWNVADSSHLTLLSTPLVDSRNLAQPLAFSPDGRTLVTSSADHTVRLWNVADPAHPTPLDQPLTGHTDAVSSVAFSPDGRTLATGSADHTVRLWNVADPAHPTPLDQPSIGHTDAVSSVAFSPDGRTLVTGSADHTVRLWALNIDQAIQRICATTANTLTPTKWDQYVSKDLPYHPPCP